jgi:hypothetical protein
MMMGRCDINAGSTATEQAAKGSSLQERGFDGFDRVAEILVLPDAHNAPTGDDEP